MAVNTLYQHCCLAGKPLNFDPNNAFEATQTLEPISRYVYSCMGWKRETYAKQRDNGFGGLFPGHMALVEVGILAGMLIKYEEDFLLYSKIEEAIGSHTVRLELRKELFLLTKKGINFSSYFFRRITQTVPPPASTPRGLKQKYYPI